MAALVGFIMIALIVILLLKGKMSPIVVLAVIPTSALGRSGCTGGHGAGDGCQ